MARPREFDSATVLDKALHLFWQQGYARTSISDLLVHTGLQRQSLYNTFGNKHQLYLAALDRYCEEARASVLAPLIEETSARAGITGVLQNVLAEATGEEHRRGCFIVNTIVERAPHDVDSSTRVRVSLETIALAIQATLEHAQETGELPPERDAQALAHFFTSIILGLRVMTKADCEIDMLKNTVQQALRLLD